MALIICPECNGSISDKAEICIHCGYPMSTVKDDKSHENHLCMIKGRQYNLEPVLESVKAKNIGIIPLIRSIVPNLNQSEACSLLIMIEETLAIPPEFSREIFHQHTAQQLIEEKKEKLRKKGIDPDVPVSCPSCGSTQFTTVQRGHSLLLGWWGSGDPQNVCQKCGYKWTPGKKW